MIDVVIPIVGYIKALVVGRLTMEESRSVYLHCGLSGRVGDLCCSCGKNK